MEKEYIYLDYAANESNNLAIKGIAQTYKEWECIKAKGVKDDEK